MTFEEFTASWLPAIEGQLEVLLPPVEAPPSDLHAAMRHAMFPGGKRLRPMLALLGAKAVGGDLQAALRPAAGLECLHTYSLVHDDLPAMDDDALRRGRPTVHVAFDEATAILVGDALLTHAFEVLAGDEPARAREHARVLARAAGSRGMVGGQALDLSLEVGGARTRDAVEGMHARKTAALFAAACEHGAIAAGRAEARAEAARYGGELGLLFQAVDDLLDVTGDAATLGKTPGKDAALERATLVAALGLEGARRRAEERAASLRIRAERLGSGPGAPLHELVDFVLERRA